jgi:hypothetical protein
MFLGISAGGEAVVGWGFTAEEAPELAGLDFEHAAVGHFVAEVGVGDFGVHTAIPSFPKAFASVFVEEGAA